MIFLPVIYLAAIYLPGICLLGIYLPGIHIFEIYRAYMQYTYTISQECCYTKYHDCLMYSPVGISAVPQQPDCESYKKINWQLVIKSEMCSLFVCAVHTVFSSINKDNLFSYTSIQCYSVSMLSVIHAFSNIITCWCLNC